MTNIIEAALEGSYSVRINGRLLDYSHDYAKSGVMLRAAKRLIREGADPETLVSVSRNGTKLYGGDITLGAWAQLTSSEGRRREPRVRRLPPPVSQGLPLD